MIRIAVVSDIHGNLPALEAVVADAGALGCNRFINLGDILSGPLWPLETATYLIERNWLTISGNHERQLLTQRRDEMGASDRFAAELLIDSHWDWLNNLPASMALTDRIFLCHGTPGSDLEYFLETVEPNNLRCATQEEAAARLENVDFELTLCGHTHVANQITLANGHVIANPGSVGLQAFEWDKPYQHSVEVGDPEARYAIVHEDLRVEHRTVSYDHEYAAKKAKKEGFDDWACALRTGRVN
jgi:predicted phosphodiesterase